MNSSLRRDVAKFQAFNQKYTHNNDADKEDLTKNLTEYKYSVSDKELIIHAFKNNIISSSLDNEIISTLTRELEYFSFAPGETVVKQGQNGSYFFIIQSGTFLVKVAGSVVAKMIRGQSFGEIALMYNTKRTATIISETKGGLWGVHRDKYRKHLQRASENTFEENREFIETVPVFSPLTAAQRLRIVEVIVVQTFAKGQKIVSQGEFGNVLYIIKRGTANVYIDDELIRQLFKGDHFGERALLYDEPRSATIVASTELECISIDRAMLQQIVGDLQTVLYRNIESLALKSSNVFKELTDEQLECVMKASQIVNFRDGVSVQSKNIPSSNSLRYIIVLEGYLLVTLQNKKIVKLTRGQGFGEEYVLRPSASFIHRIDCITSCTLALIYAKELFNNLGTTDIAATFLQNKKTFAIMKMYVFRYLTPLQLQILVDNFKDVEFKAGEYIIRQSDIGTSFYIIKEGIVDIVYNNTKIRSLSKNDYFGERALLYEEPRSASVICSSDVCKLWQVDKQVFLSVVQGHMLKHLEDRIALQDTRVEFNDLIKIGTMGSGAFGVVQLVKHSKSGLRYALKCVKKAAIIRHDQINSIKLERSIMCENDHPFILKFVRSFKDSKYLYFLLELCTGGDLYDALRTLGILNKQEAQFYFGCILLAIEYLHERKILFRDLKPENVLIDAYGYPKLIDFGCAKRVGFRTNTITGTPHYMAPEVIIGKGYGASCDVWSMGIMLYEFICGPLPFANDANDLMDIYRAIINAPLKFPAHVVDVGTKDIIQKLLCRVPEIRLGCTLNGLRDIKNHDFFSDFSWESLLSYVIQPPLVNSEEKFNDNLIRYTDLSDDEDAANSEVIDLTGVDPDWDADF